MRSVHADERGYFEEGRRELKWAIYLSGITSIDLIAKAKSMTTA